MSMLLNYCLSALKKMIFFPVVHTIFDSKQNIVPRLKARAVEDATNVRMIMIIKQRSHDVQTNTFDSLSDTHHDSVLMLPVCVGGGDGIEGAKECE